MITASGPVTISGSVNIGYGNLTDTGTGTAIVSGNITGYSSTTPGLLEGQIDADIDLTGSPSDPIYGEDVVLSPVMAETYTNAPASSVQPTADHTWAEDDEWVYTGEIYVAPSVANPAYGYLSFWAYEEDKSALSIDGDQLWTTTDFDGGNHAEVTLTPGWHTFDLRVASNSAVAGGDIPDEEDPESASCIGSIAGPTIPWPTAPMPTITSCRRTTAAAICSGSAAIRAGSPWMAPAPWSCREPTAITELPRSSRDCCWWAAN